MNVVNFEGNVVFGPESKTVGDKQVVNFRLAINNGKRTVNGKEIEDTLFQDCEVWNKSGETFGKFVRKGTGIWVTGSLHCNSQVVTIQNADGTTKERNFPYYKIRVRDCLCVQTKAYDGIYRWNGLQIQQVNAKWTGLPDFVTALRISVRMRNANGKMSGEEFIVLGGTAAAARSRLRIWLLTKYEDSEIISSNVLEEILILM